MRGLCAALLAVLTMLGLGACLGDSETKPSAAIGRNEGGQAKRVGEGCELRGRLSFGKASAAGWVAALGRLDIPDAGTACLDSEGRFTIRVKDPGKYQLSVTDSKSRPGSVHFTAGVTQWINLVRGANEWTVEVAAGRVEIENLPSLPSIREFAASKTTGGGVALRAKIGDGLVWFAEIFAGRRTSWSLLSVPAGKIDVFLVAKGESFRLEPRSKPILTFSVESGQSKTVSLP